MSSPTPPRGLPSLALTQIEVKSQLHRPAVLHNTVIRYCIYPVSYVTTTYCFRTACG